MVSLITIIIAAAAVVVAVIHSISSSSSNKCNYLKFFLENTPIFYEELNPCKHEQIHLLEYSNLSLCSSRKVFHLSCSDSVFNSPTVFSLVHKLAAPQRNLKEECH
jgi:hypothetical protein